MNLRDGRLFHCTIWTWPTRKEKAKNRSTNPAEIKSSLKLLQDAVSAAEIAYRQPELKQQSWTSWWSNKKPSRGSFQLLAGIHLDRVKESKNSLNTGYAGHIMLILQVFH
jgi:hypothetical protein